ncbi:MAG: type III-A CRISPR-associated protein Cas10/Csm1 [Desulfobacteraceae bacterium]|nr:type III-A CRISPR-associated protein Cas10/Csm1 [Desulfobacteraceae bacterium]
MDDTTLKIAIAGFSHDMGKLAGKDVLNLDPEEFDRRAADFLPVRDGRYTHGHALYTALFIDRFIDCLPEEFSRPWGEGDGLVKLAASHHSPSTAMEWIIAEADRISSGMDREEYDAAKNAAVSFRDFEKTRMVPILECLDPSGQADFTTSECYGHAYPLQPLSPENIFPRPAGEVMPSDRETAKAQYAALFKGFAEALERIPHRGCIGLWFEHFESLVMQYASHLPAARAGNVIPDVSLFDHMKTTAALAAALYVYHRDTGTLEAKAVRAEDPEKFLLVTGEFHGIQSFIFTGFGDTRRFRSKLLRGRSFYVSAVMEMAAHMLCTEIGIPVTSVILNAGGKFTILAPNTSQAGQAVEQTAQKIEQWFAGHTFGEAGISISSVAAAPADFKSGGYQDLHDRMNRAVLAKKYNRIDLDAYGGVIENYFDGVKEELCPFCGKRPVHASAVLREGYKACTLCRDHVFLGENLVRKDVLAVLDANTDSHAGAKKLMEPLFGRYQFVFPEGLLNGHEADAMESKAEKKELLRYWAMALPSGGPPAQQATLKFFNGYVPAYSEEDLSDPRIHAVPGEDEVDLHRQARENAPKMFNHIAALAKQVDSDEKLAGVEALGVVKADVDNLGLLMSCGLRENLYSISRIATLSRQMNNFFAVFLPHFLGKHPAYKNIYTVFAGGDDLFLIGPWNHIMDFAPELAETFSAYVCKNSNVTLSAGISFHKPHTPVNAMAEAAESALERSKADGRNRLTVFGETVVWDEAFDLYGIRDVFERWLEQEYVSPTMLYRLNRFVEMADREKKLTSDDGGIDMQEMECTRWRALLAYAAERNVLKTDDPADRKNRVAEVHGKAAEWLTSWGGSLRVPLWYVQYNRR